MISPAQRTLILKQKPSTAAIRFGLDKLDVSLYPGASQSYALGMERDGRTWITGLNENAPAVLSLPDKARVEKQKEIKATRKFLEERLGLDLGPHSEYWHDYYIQLLDARDPRKTTRMLDLTEPADLLLYTVALANHRLAPDYDDLRDHQYSEAFMYAYDPQAHVSRRVLLQELKDEVGGLISASKTNKDKLFYWCYALGRPVNTAMSRDDLYRIIAEYRDTLKSVEQYETLKETLSQSNTWLQLNYSLQQAKRRRLLPQELGQYTFNGTPLGRTFNEAISFLSDPLQIELLTLLEAAVSS